MGAKCPIGDIVNCYSSLQASLPDVEIDSRIWGLKALELFSAMAKTGPNFRQTVTYLIEHDIKLNITRETKGIGAGWHETLSGERWISIDQSFGFVDSMIALGHETCHLRQDTRVRCSVEGEYYAWRFAYQLRAELASAGTNLPLSEDEQKLASLPDNPTRVDLKMGQALMQKMAGPDYAIGKAPLQGNDWPTVFVAAALKFYNGVMDRGEII